MKRAITVLFLGLTSLVLGASMIGCVGATPDVEERESDTTPLTEADRAAYTQAQEAARAQQEGGHVGRATVRCYTDGDYNGCCGATLCCNWYKDTLLSCQSTAG
jgi:hypothetical protein